MSSAPILIPGSPPRAANVSSTLEGKYSQQRQEAFYGSLVSARPNAAAVSASNNSLTSSQASQRPTSFVASSARANRNADARNRKQVASAKQRSKFIRNSEAGFGQQIAVPSPKPPITSASKEDEIDRKRDESLRLIEELTMGPKSMEPPEDDIHFMKLEPTSGIVLRKRFILHKDFEPHLEGRYYIPISTLYSIAVPGKSDDGDFTLPVQGDWMTMGVITAKSKILRSKEKHFDALGRLLDSNGKPVRDCDTGSTSAIQGQGLVSGSGETKKLGERDFFVLTLMDLSSKPNKFGEHDGSQEVELSVFKSDSTWLEAGGERKYSGGSFGAYEKLSSAGLGALVCVMIPKIRTSKSHDKGRNVLRLNPRTGKTILIVGMSADYGSCQATPCTKFVDKRSGMKECSDHINCKLDKARNNRPEVQNSWRQKTSSPYDLSNGMAMGTKSKSYELDTNDSCDPNDSTSRLFDVRANFGRVKEERAQESDKLIELLQLNKRLSRSTCKNVGNFPALSMNLKGSEASECRLEKLVKKRRQEQVSNKPMTSLDIMASQAAGSKVIEAARKALQERKREAERAVGLHSKQHKNNAIGAVADKGKKRMMSAAIEEESDIPSGLYRATNGDLKKLTPTSSKLLARHTADCSQLPKPILRRKRINLPPTVRPPPGESFYASESSDEEFEEIIKSEVLREHLQELKSQSSQPTRPAIGACTASDSDSDLEIIPA